MTDKIVFLRKTPLFHNLSDPQLQAMASSLSFHLFHREQIIFDKGEPGDCLYIIESGRVRIFAMGANGQEISVNVYQSGDVFGELAILDGLPRSAGAIAIEPVKAYVLWRSDFQRHLKTMPEIAINIIEVLSKRLRITTENLESFAFLDVQTRVVRKLLELAQEQGQKTPEGIWLRLGLNQQELASLVGTSREWMNKMLNNYRKRGLITLQGHDILITDLAELRLQGGVDLL